MCSSRSLVRITDEFAYFRPAVAYLWVHVNVHNIVKRAKKGICDFLKLRTAPQTSERESYTYKELKYIGASKESLNELQ